MRNILVDYLILFGFCSLNALGQYESWDLPENFTILSSCLNSDHDIIFILGAYVDSDDEYTSMSVIEWETYDDSYSILSSNLFEQIQNTEFNGTVYPPNNITTLFCPLNKLYLLQGFGDPAHSLNMMYMLEVSDLNAPRLKITIFSQLILLLLIIVFY